MILVRVARLRRKRAGIQANFCKTEGKRGRTGLSPRQGAGLKCCWSTLVAHSGARKTRGPGRFQMESSTPWTIPNRQPSANSLKSSVQEPRSAAAAIGRGQAAGRQACDRFLRRSRLRCDIAIQQHLRARLAAKKRSAPGVSGGGPRVIRSGDSALRYPVGTGRAHRSACGSGVMSPGLDNPHLHLGWRSNLYFDDAK